MGNLIKRGKKKSPEREVRIKFTSAEQQLVSLPVLFWSDNTIISWLAGSVRVAVVPLTSVFSFLFSRLFFLPHDFHLRLVTRIVLTCVALPSCINDPRLPLPLFAHCFLSALWTLIQFVLLGSLFIFTSFVPNNRSFFCIRVQPSPSRDSVPLLTSLLCTVTLFSLFNSGSRVHLTMDRNEIVTSFK